MIIPISDLRPDMALAKDVSVNGIRVLKKGIVLTAAVIDALEKRGVTEVEVVAPESNEDHPDPDVLEIEKRFSPYCNSIIMMEIKSAIIAAAGDFYDR